MSCGRADAVQTRSNVVPLHDIRSIRWRRYSCSSTSNTVPSSDPVQLSLARAESRHIICACAADSDGGRNKGDDSTSVINPNPGNRSLWIFWFGDEPLMRDIFEEGLREVEVGCWDRGVTSKCMKVLLDALKSHAERSLLELGEDIRLGRYIVTNLRNQHEGPALLLSLHAFLLGSHLLCLSVDVKQACTQLELVTSTSLLAAFNEANGLPALLSPCGVPARLHGRPLSSAERCRRCMDTWTQHYPVPPCASDVPDVVDVSIGGVHMVYPSSLVVMTPNLNSNEPGPARHRPAPPPTCSYNFGLQHSWHSGPTVNRVSKRLHADVVYAGATDKTCRDEDSFRQSLASPGAESTKRAAKSQSFLDRTDKRKKRRIALSTPEPGAVLAESMASGGQQQSAMAAAAAAAAAAVPDPLGSRPSSHLSCLYSPGSSLPSPFLASNQKEVSIKVEDSSKPASPMPAPVTSCAVTSLPTLALSLKHEVASSASPTSAVSTGGAPHVHPSAASASTDLFIPLSSRTTAGRKHVKSESESVADKLCSLYKLPSVNIMSPNQLMPWMLEDGSKEKIAISSIFTCSKDKTATGVSRTPLAYAYTAGSMASSNPCDQVLTPPSVDDQPSSSIKRPASAGQPTTSAPTLNSASCRSSAKKDYTQLGNITIDDEKEMFSSDGDDSDNDEEAEVLTQPSSTEGNHMSAGYFMHGQTMGGLLSAAASAGSVGGGAGNIAGPAMAEDCELGRMYPTPPSCSTQVGSDPVTSHPCQSDVVSTLPEVDLYSAVQLPGHLMEHSALMDASQLVYRPSTSTALRSVTRSSEKKTDSGVRSARDLLSPFSCHSHDQVVSDLVGMTATSAAPSSPLHAAEKITAAGGRASLSLLVPSLAVSPASPSYTPMCADSAVSSVASPRSPFSSAYQSQYFTVDSVDFAFLLMDWSKHGTLDRVAQQRLPLAWWQLAERPHVTTATPSLHHQPKSSFHLQSIVAISDEVLRLKQYEPEPVSLTATQRGRVVFALSTCYKFKHQSSNLLAQPHIAAKLGQYEVLSDMQVLSASCSQLSEAVNHVQKSISTALALLQSSLLPVSLEQAAVSCRRKSLSWEDLKKRLPGSGMECYRLGVPSLLVGLDNNDLVSSSPFILPYWEKLSLQCASQQCHLHYTAFVVEGSNVDCTACRTFFRDLGYVFKDCQFGDHNPLPRARGGTDAVVKVDPGNIRNRLSEISECIDSVLPVPEQHAPASDNLDYMSMSGLRQSHRFVLYLVLPTKQTAAALLNESAAGSADGDFQDSSDDCMSYVLKWLDDLDPVTRRSAVQLQIVLDSQLLDGMNSCSRPSQPVAVIDKTNTATWCNSSKQLAADVYTQALKPLVDATRFEAITDFAGSTDLYHRLVSHRLMEQVDGRPRGFIRSPPFVLAPSRLRSRRMPGASSSPAKVRDSTSPLASATSAAASVSASSEGRSTPVSTLSSGSTTSLSSSSSSQPVLLYCSYAWVQSVLCATLMDGSGQQMHTITLHASSRSLPVEPTILRNTLQELLNMATQFIAQTLLSWQLVVCHIGPMDSVQLCAWQEILNVQSLWRLQNKVWCTECYKLPSSFRSRLASVSVISIQVPSMQLILDGELRESAKSSPVFSSSSVSSLHNPWTELCISNTHCAERMVSPPTLGTLIPPADRPFTPSAMDATNPRSIDAMSTILPSPNSPGIAESMLAAFGASPSTCTQPSSTGLPPSSLATAGDCYHPVSTLMDEDCLGSEGMDTSSDTAATAGGGGGGGGGSTVSGKASTAPLSMAYLATSVGMDNASAIFLDHPRMCDNASASLLQASLHVHSKVEDQKLQQQHRQRTGAPSVSHNYLALLRHVMEDFYSQCWLSSSWSKAAPTTCLPPHVTKVTSICVALQSLRKPAPSTTFTAPAATAPAL